MLKQLIREPIYNVNFKATRAEIEAIKANAGKWANGNVSAWLKYAGVKCRPPKSEIAD